ncbi:unnamed protein product, partial [Brassica oleracea var. botrytis]
MNLRGIQIFLLIFEDRSKLSHSESGISLDLDGIFYLGADLEGFLKIGLFGGKSGIQERNLAWECDKLIRSLYLKAGGRMDWGIFFVKVSLCSCHILGLKELYQIYSIMFLHMVYFTVVWVWGYGYCKLGNSLELHDYNGSYGDVGDQLRLLIGIVYG